jgi:hypothetical protein
MKACRDCIHVEQTNSESEVQRCLHPKSYVESLDYFDGTTRTIARSFPHMRMLGPCGADAKLFAAAQED